MSTTNAHDKSKKQTLCGSCECELEPDHAGIQCVQAHHYCVDCSQQIVNIYFEDPRSYTPMRCLQCHVELNSSVFERQLSAAQHERYQDHMFVLVGSKIAVNEGERLDCCPFCTYAVIRPAHDNMPYIHCEHQKCGITSCRVCRKATPTFVDEMNYEEEDLTEWEKHFICANLAADKEEFDRHLELGQKMPCPNCGLAGMKDDACTHMTCPTCAQLWCYFCGKKVEDCDGAVSSSTTPPNIYGHNEDWNTNPNRCPMYFTQLNDHDTNWPEDDKECQMRFHRIRSLRLLREVCEKLGKEKMDALEAQFRVLSTCGFTDEEILNEDLTLIQRDGEDE